jgi:hypothetical protein
VISSAIRIPALATGYQAPEFWMVRSTILHLRFVGHVHFDSDGAAIAG